MKTFQLCILSLDQRRTVHYLNATLLLVLSVCASFDARAQTIAQDVVIDDHVPVGEPLEKAIDYFTSPAFPSVVIGNGRGGLYLYRSTTGQLHGPWKRSTIVARGSAYERARPSWPSRSRPATPRGPKAILRITRGLPAASPCFSGMAVRRKRPY